MFRKTQMILLAGCLACSPAVRAQAPDATDDGTAEVTPDKTKTGDSAGPPRFWQATVAGGSFMVALDRIVSVSRAKYLLDGAAIVDEVTVDTAGQALVRFYFISPATDAIPGNAVSELGKRGRELADKATERGGATTLQNMVIKKYPDTTHAKSIEYRLTSEADLTALFNSVKNAWETGRGRQFNAK